MSIFCSQTIYDDDIIITFDGNGTNREAMQAYLKGINSKARILTFDKDANCALSQRFIYGSSVLFSGADSSLRMHSYELEHLIFTDNKVLTKAMKLNIKMLYMDTCGGPRHNLTNILEFLPNLRIFAVTIAKRKRPLLEADFENYFSTPLGMMCSHTFNSNPRVICRMYEKRS